MVNKLEGGKSGTPASAPEAAKPNSKYFGRKNAAAIVAAGGIVAALFAIRSCQGGPDRLVPPTTAPSATVTTPAPACAQPVANICNLELGEHDPHSPNWSPAKCGVCGDGVTENQPWETPQNCPVDFHCGDGACQIGLNIYGAYIRPTADGGVYSLGTVQITESNDPNSPNFCESDCGRRGQPAPAPVGSGRRTDRREPREPREVTTTAPPVSTGEPCPAEVTQRIAPRVSSSLMGNPGAARSASGADSNTVVRARVSIRVTNGVPTVTGISLSCPGGACAGGSMSPGSINLAGIPLGPVSCPTSVSVNIPPG